MRNSPHRILGVSEDADVEEIRDAYRAKIKKAHPDTGGSEEEFKRVKQAYESLMEEDDIDSTSSRTGQNYVEKATVEYLNYRVVEENNWTENEAFQKAKEANLGEQHYGKFTVGKNQTILQAAEEKDCVWPFSCRGGACANCTVKVIKGDISTPESHILSREFLNKKYRLSCIGRPLSGHIKLFYNMKIEEELEELLLPSQSPFEDRI